MSELSIRTCTRCGKKKPSNRIYSKSVPKKISGSSSRSINIFTLIGGFLGDKGSATALKQWLFQSSNRKYGAELTKDINLCSLCYHRMPSQSGGYGIFKIIFFPSRIFSAFVPNPCINFFAFRIFALTNYHSFWVPTFP